jgi:hypothetical protein
MRRNGLAGLGTSLTLALLLAACGSASGAPTVAPTPAESPAPTGPVGLFTGHDVCSDVDAEGAQDTGGVVCERVVTDARLSGRMESDGQGGVGSSPDLFTEWRNFTMSNEGGSWTCGQLLIGRPGGAGWADQVCTGEGGYLGLTAYVHAISGNNANDFGVLGWVEETP